jgi:hypothetical protein
VIVVPAIVTVPVREGIPVLAADVRVTVPLPLPLVGLNVRNAALLVAVQLAGAQPAGETLIVIVWVPPSDGATGTAVGVTLNVHGAACVTVTGCPATVTVPVRCGPVFAVTLMFAEPLPDPDAGLTVANAAPLDAVQFAGSHPEGDAVTLTVVDPAALPALMDVGITAKTQGSAPPITPAARKPTAVPAAAPPTMPVIASADNPPPPAAAPPAAAPPPAAPACAPMPA